MENENAVNAIEEAAIEALNETVSSTTSEVFNFFKSFCNWNFLFKAIGALLMIFIIWLIFTLIKTKLDVILWVLNRLGTGFG